MAEFYSIQTIFLIITINMFCNRSFDVSSFFYEHFLTPAPPHPILPQKYIIIDMLSRSKVFLNFII